MKNNIPGREINQDVVNLARRYCLVSFSLIAGGSWNGDILIADLEDLEKLVASENYPRRINAKGALITRKWKNSYSQLQLVQHNCQEETTNSENPL